MNTQNYASLEACQRLVDAGIVLETETVWRKARLGHRYLTRKALYHRTTDILAPSMVEVWRELPADVEVDGEKYNLCAHKIGGVNCAEYVSDLPETIGSAYGANMADNLIDLLIWVKEKP